jgi:CheY-like chemotaxis protein/two-component sensor histidine kinase
MHAVVQYVGQLERACTDARLAQPIHGANLALQSMHDLLDSILEVAHLIAGTIEPNEASFDIAPLIDRVDAQMRPAAEAKGLSLTVRASTVRLQSDEVLLERIVRNLIANALTYTEVGGVVLDARVRQGRLVLRVADTGIGIPVSAREKIFEEFFQVANARRDRRMGLGLGLAIVRHLASIVGADIAVRSRLGRGTIFRLTVPVRSDAAGHAPVRTVQAPAHDARGALVVLIDDSDESRDATAASLTLMGCRVVSAVSSAEANSLLTHLGDVPLLIVADYRLRDETGLEAIAAVIGAQHASFGSDLAIGAFVVTGDVTAAVEERIRGAGHRMLRKPLRFDALEQAVHSSLASIAEDAGGVALATADGLSASMSGRSE